MRNILKDLSKLWKKSKFACRLKNKQNALVYDKNWRKNLVTISLAFTHHEVNEGTQNIDELGRQSSSLEERQQQLLTAGRGILCACRRRPITMNHWRRWKNHTSFFFSVADPWHFGVDPDTRIHASDLWIRILLFSPLTFKTPTKNKIYVKSFKSFSAFYFLKLHLLHFSKIKSQKEVTKQ